MLKIINYLLTQKSPLTQNWGRSFLHLKKNIIVKRQAFVDYCGANE